MWFSKIVFTDCLAQDALAVQRAAVEEHAQEQAVVAGRAVQAAVALHLRGQGGRHRPLHELPIGAARVHRDDARILRRRHQVARVVHAERLQDARLEERVDLLSRDRLDDVAEHARAGAIGPALARIEQQRQIQLGLAWSSAMIFVSIGLANP